MIADNLLFLIFCCFVFYSSLHVAFKFNPSRTIRYQVYKAPVVTEVLHVTPETKKKLYLINSNTVLKDLGSKKILEAKKHVDEIIGNEESKKFITQIQNNNFMNLLISAVILGLFPTSCFAIGSTNVLFSQYDLSYYLKYFLAGGICCTISHTISVPFDVVKTRKQVSPELANLSVKEAFSKIIKDDGLSVLKTGLVPTLIGYFFQGSLKYGFYELFKPSITSLIYDANFVGTPILSFIIASSLADTIGSTVLSPFEAARVRLVANPDYAPTFATCIKNMVATNGVGSLFESLPVMLLKHIPYTIVQLSFFETLTSFLYHMLRVNGVDDISGWRFYVTLFSAAVSAFFSTLASQPGDTLFSIINKNRSKNMKNSIESRPSESLYPLIVSSIRDLGIRGLYVGTNARLFHVGVIVITQLLVYDYVKQFVGLPITGLSH